LGTIDKGRLGVTSTHEHVYIDLSGFYHEKEQTGYNGAADKVEISALGILNRDPYALRDNLLLADESEQLEELMYFKRAGGCSVVDATSVGINRNPEKLRRAAEKIGLNIVCGTGYYVGPTHGDWVKNADARELAKVMINEIRNGIEGTDVRAGVIGEIGVSEYFTESERKTLQAAALAYRETGAPVMAHINPWTEYGVEAARTLLDGGVKPGKLCVCHVDVENKKPYIDELLDMGVYVEFDNFGKEYYVDRSARRFGYGSFARDEARVALIAELISEGRLCQLLLSCDVCLKTLLHRYGGWGYDHVLTNIRPMLLEAGVTSEAIETMLVSNPARYLDVK